MINRAIFCKLGAWCRWETTEWSECSTSCDRGRQSRSVECRQRVSAVLSVPVTADRCIIDQPRPHTQRACNVDRPCVRWTVGNWSQVRRWTLSPCLTFIETSGQSNLVNGRIAVAQSVYSTTGRHMSANPSHCSRLFFFFFFLFFFRTDSTDSPGCLAIPLLHLKKISSAFLLSVLCGRLS